MDEILYTLIEKQMLEYNNFRILIYINVLIIIFLLVLHLFNKIMMSNEYTTDSKPVDVTKPQKPTVIDYDEKFALLEEMHNLSKDYLHEYQMLIDKEYLSRKEAEKNQQTNYVLEHIEKEMKEIVAKFIDNTDYRFFETKLSHTFESDSPNIFFEGRESGINGDDDYFSFRVKLKTHTIFISAGYINYMKLRIYGVSVIVK